MIPAGRERDAAIARWLGWRQERYLSGWRWVGKDGNKLSNDWADTPARLIDLLPNWSTDDAAALTLATVELPKRGHFVTIDVWPEFGNRYPVAVLGHRGEGSRPYYSHADSLADAVTQVCCQISEEAPP